MTRHRSTPKPYMRQIDYELSRPRQVKGTALQHTPQPATNAQLKLMKKYDMNYVAGVTARQAYDIITCFSKDKGWNKTI